MFAKWYERQCAHYPPRWYWPILHVNNGHVTDVVYLTRIYLGPRTPWGRLYLHIFHREDLDRDPHDHPFAFWTLPLNQGYVEAVFDSISECWKQLRVPRWRVSYRPAEHTHRIIGTDTGRWPLVTLVWRGSSERRWGFWIHTTEQAPQDTERFWTPYQNYVYDIANVDGADVACPGFTMEKPND